MTIKNLEKMLNGRSIDALEWSEKLELMKYHDDFQTEIIGKNEDGENVSVSINETNISVQTFQNNGWIRTNIYYDDLTVEELYDK